MKGLVATAILSFLLALTLNCGSSEASLGDSNPSATPEADIRPRATATPEQSSNPLVSSIYGKFPNADEVWGSFIRDGRYRIANESDFHMPQSVLQYDRGYFKNSVRMPVMQADANGDYESLDCTVIVVDNTKTGTDRFGVVVFLQPTKDMPDPKPVWVLQDTDLSTAALGYSRDGVYISKYHEDGTFDFCNIKWDKTRSRFLCDFSYVDQLPVKY